MDTDQKLRKELLNYLGKDHTHKSLAAAVKGFSFNLINQKIAGVSYSAWEILEHIRITQADMVDFIRNPKYKNLKWPEDYWPKEGEQGTKERWAKAIQEHEKDLATLKKIVKNLDSELFAPIAWGDGQTILKEVLQVIDHNAYHIGQLILLRKALNAWKET